MKRLLILLALVGTTLLVMHAQPAHVFADAISAAKGQACAGAGLAGADCNASTADSSISKLVGAAVNILSIVIGIAAVIVILVSGFKYITSGGDSNNISSAKNTLVYALVGLTVAAFAQLLVRYVIGIVN